MREYTPRFESRRHIFGCIVVLAGLAVLALAAGSAAAAVADEPANAGAHEPTDALAASFQANESVSEEAYEEAVPEPGDRWYEASASDGSWISYVNPRDEYRSPYLGGGSGKVCVTLLNEAGEPIVGESIPDTTVTVPTGESLEWHTGADPMTVEYPLTDHYERPLDADQFGTDPDLPQGDGYLDSHCIEWHGLPEDATIEYGEAQIEGEHAEDVELVGYIQQAHEAWDTDVDPIEDAVSYEEAGGGWTYETDASHGQAVVVLQLAESTGDEGSSDDPGSNATDSNASDGTGSNGADDTLANESTGSAGDDGSTGGTDRLPGFGPFAAILALALAAGVAGVGGRVRSRR
ncbi:PGF-CTERM sorting domain-containing protein [Halovivax sp.]|uniref:PGF-CTERM sorting domain-containing protein n=1 Tax=Halovivax sp. TaxID=1935978 RepID=UPI0025C3BC1C|nr:PGF-CTERM sorting domain-containing protein [Halovivax sp.]